ncbi:SPOR domain-containing protein [Thalassotalea piscium]
MSTPFQNRLVGTVIVAAIAIIFLPDILDGEKKTYQEEFDQIPAAPKVDFQSTNKQLDEQKFEQLAQESVSDETAIDEQQSNDKDDNTSKTGDSNNVIKVASLPKPEKIITKTQQAAQKASTEVKSNTQLPEQAVIKEAWVIQLGSFRYKKNVDELLKKLKDNDYTAFSRPIKTRTGNLTKVFVGPELIKSSLEKQIPALKKLTNIEGKIARFKPTK